MEEQSQEAVNNSNGHISDSNNLQKRPFFLSILCFATFVYSAFFVLLFLLGIIYNNWLSGLLNDFVQENTYNRISIFFLSFLGFLLFSFSFIGTYNIWKLKRKGLYIYSVSTVLLIFASYFVELDSLINTIIFLLLIMFFFLFYNRLTYK